MPRVKRGVTALKRRKSVLKDAKGYRFRRSKTERGARDALRHALWHAFAHRRDKKNVMRRAWNVTINAYLREHGLTYSVFIHKLAKKGVSINRKMLAHLAEYNDKSLERLLAFIS